MDSLLRSRPFQTAATDLYTDGNFTGCRRKPMESLKMHGSPLRFVRKQDTHWRGLEPRRNYFAAAAMKDSCGLIKEFKESVTHRQDLEENGLYSLEELKGRFLKFKKQNYLENLNHYQNLARGQSPKFMVIACADSRVCPSKILGFQPGEAFTVRNVANLVPPYQHGVSETSAALEFAVNSLEVSNILVIGHSCCGGIRALMSLKNKLNTKSFIGDWVSVAENARLSTEAVVGSLSFEKQCTHCEKESINGSLGNLLTYPWIEKKAAEGALSLHGGYYDFTNCSFEKWSLVYRDGQEGGSKFSIYGSSTWS